MYSCKLFGSYPCDNKHTKDFQNIFSWLISVKVYLSAPIFSKRIIKSGLNNGRWKTDVVNMSLPHKQLNFEIRGLKSTPKPNLRLIQLKLGKLEFLGVTIYKHDNDVPETKC